MLESRMRWKDNSSRPSAQEPMGLGVSPLVEQLLIQRGITSEEVAKRFLHPSLEDLHSPELISDIDVATERIHPQWSRVKKFWFSEIMMQMVFHPLLFY
nr:hypothetical protein [Terribacillus saccharophilus]